jgi:hypothetical protein
MEIIITEGVVYQYSSGLYGKKEFIDLKEAIFSYEMHNENKIKPFDLVGFV